MEMHTSMMRFLVLSSEQLTGTIGGVVRFARTRRGIAGPEPRLSGMLGP